MQIPIGAALAWDDDHCDVIVIPGWRGTHLVNRIRGRRRKRQRVRTGAPDRALTGNAGLAAVTELCVRLGVIEAIDAAAGAIKERDRGFSAGELLSGLAAAQLAGQRLTPVPGLSSTRVVTT